MVTQFLQSHRGFWRWSLLFFVILGVSVIAHFVFEGRSIAKDWSLMASQIAVVFVSAIPAGFLISALSKGCIVCRDDVCVNENAEAKK